MNITGLAGAFLEEREDFAFGGVAKCQHQLPKLTWYTRHTPLPSPMPWQVISNLVETNRIVGFTLKSFWQRTLSLKVKTWPVTMDPHSKQVGAISWILNFSWNHPITLLFQLQTVAQLGMFVISILKPYRLSIYQHFLKISILISITSPFNMQGVFFNWYSP